jgi:prepilin-type N-terminal cleavage/methylation domain-containing protein
MMARALRGKAQCQNTEPKTVAAFTLIELLVVIAIIGVLASFLLPVLALGVEKAKVARAHGELNNIGLALTMYFDDYKALPPARVNCNSDLSSHWCELPKELAQEGYLPGGTLAGREANLLDVFNPGHTYKYAAPGLRLLNGSTKDTYALWVSSNYPNMSGAIGAKYTNLASSPVRWAVWSLGPKPASARSQHDYAPMSSDSWYRRAGEGGVILHYSDRYGTLFRSQ